MKLAIDSFVGCGNACSPGGNSCRRARDAE
jgi:hypothetical protein